MSEPKNEVSAYCEAVDEVRRNMLKAMTYEERYERWSDAMDGIIALIDAAEKTGLRKPYSPTQRMQR